MSTKTSEKATTESNIAGSSVLRVTFEGVEMANMDWFSQSDVFWQAEIPLEGPDGILWQAIHRSEHIMDNNNPRWKPAVIHIHAQKPFDLHKPIRFCFYDWEDHLKHQPMGRFMTTVHRLQQAKQQGNDDGHWDLSKAFVTQSEGGQEFGRIVVVDIEVELRKEGTEEGRRLEEDSVLALTLEGVDMANMDGIFGISDPFFVVETPMLYADGVTWQEFHKSESIEDTLNPRWKPAFLDLDRLCRSSIDKPIRISFFDREDSGQHQPMGHCVVSIRRLLRSVVAAKDDDGDQWDLSRALFTTDDQGQEFGRIVVVDAVLVSK